MAAETYGHAGRHSETPELDQIARLTLALVGEKWRATYLNSATFHDQINTLARMLPPWIDALGETANRSARERDRERPEWR